MAKKKICNLIIIDASGSMSDKASEVRGELKSLFQDIKNNSKVKPTTIVCDFSGAGDFNVLCNTKFTNELSDDIADKYVPRGMTALYDAIGKSFQLIPNNKFDGVFVSVITDGLENDSKEFNIEAIKTLLSNKRELGWGIIFSGTTEEAIKSAKMMGFSSRNTIIYDNSAEGLNLTRGTRSRSFATYSAAVANNDDLSLVNDNLINEEEA